MIKKISLCLILILIGFGIGYTQGPEKVKTVTKYKIKTQIQEKIRTKTVVQELPSGEKRTTIVYQNDKTTKVDEVKQEKKEIINRDLQYSVSVGTHYLAMDRKIIGNFSIGGYVTVNSMYRPDNYGVYLKYSF